MNGSHYHPPASPRPNRHQPSQNPFLQPRHLVAPRDRYRATQSAYDVVEDDDQYGNVMPFDEFDQRLLEQPHEDRQRAAERGRARLSLAPGPSRFFGGAVRSEMDRYAMDERDVGHGRGVDVPQLSASARLSQFMYNPEQYAEPSSDMHLVPSSSPTFQARQRRTEQHNFGNSQRTTGFQSFDEVACPTAVQRISENPPFQSQQEAGRPFQKLNPPRPQKHQTPIAYDTPTVQGIQLVPTSSLPDRLRTVFPFPNFNAVQSRCFERVFRSDDNFVLASPTGSGKTAILELAICRAVTTNATSQYKVVYQAPTKALCSERQRDWEKKFRQVGLTCAELTGDSNSSDLQNVQSANIIVTTPEKWDSITRKWKDHEKLMKLVKLFLIDEVHILKDDRGAVLEAVVSRMKSIGNGVRFVALSATVPNFQDVAAWLGRNAANSQTPAANEKFGEEFRPVKLKKHVCGYSYNSSNDFSFEKFLDGKLPDVIMKYSERKPIMVFCATRASTISTAKLLANWWSSNSHRDRMWDAPKHTVALSNKDLCGLVKSGVAFHHAGLDPNDRMQVEKGFLEGNINVICCTSTLAVGVNLPCHLVIVKNTMCFGPRGIEEYSDLEMMQMLGRAGRPQFDDSAVAVILTRQVKAHRYETLVTGQDTLESKLHLNLIDHLNAEISLGTIRDLPSARSWLTSTFLYTRLKQNPTYYKLEGSQSRQNLEEQVDDICFRDIALLREHNLVTDEEHFRCTDYGQAMTRYYVSFDTMKVFMGLPSKASLSEILSALAQASEFSNIRFRQGEKPLYKTLNKSSQIRFPIPVNLDLPAQKVSLIIQSVLGSADIAWDGDMGKHRLQYTNEVLAVFKSTNSLIRCIIDCQICSGDSISMNAALMLERSLGAKAWDDSPLQMMQVPSIGVVAARKLVNARIRSIEDLEATEAHRIEALIGRNPPFGLKVLEILKSFPRLRVSLHIQPSSAEKFQGGVKIQIKADVGFMNEKPPQKFAEKFLYVCVLVETSDGRIVHFARISGVKLGTGKSIVFPAHLTNPDQSINCYIMCDSIAGSMRSATVKPKIAPSMFASVKPPEHEPSHQSNTSKRRAESLEVQRRQAASGDDYGDDGIDDNELMNISFSDQEFDDIDNFANNAETNTRNNASKNKSSKHKGQAQPTNTATEDDHEQGPVQLDNGKWACNHKCKDKTACKHMCCRDGVDKPQKKTTKKITQDKNVSQAAPQASTQKEKKTQTKLQLTAAKRKNSHAIEELDLTQPEKKSRFGPTPTNSDYHCLEQLHKSVHKNKPTPSTSSIFHKKPNEAHDEGIGHGLSFLQHSSVQRPETSSDYGDIQFDESSIGPSTYHYDPSSFGDIPDFAAAEDHAACIDYFAKTPVTSRQSDTFGDDDSLLDATMVGLADSQYLASTTHADERGVQFTEEAMGIDYAMDFNDCDFSADIDFADTNDVAPSKVDHTESTPHTHHAPKRRSSTQQKPGGFRSATSVLDSPELKELRNPILPDVLSTKRHEVDDKTQEPDFDIADIFDYPGAIQDNMEQDDLVSEAFKSDNQVSTVKQNGLCPDAEKKEGVPDTVKKEEILDAFKDLQPWLFQEFGDIVELDED